ncbi:MAG TPA: glycosyltransferase family 4 protein [Patescibacteria group bacterium]|nr:glycosyltransferase family 4 protein [Patescibacteria group bacterium]
MNKIKISWCATCSKEDTQRDIINKMNKKIYLQYPWTFPDSPYYKYLLQDKLEDVTYLNIEKQKGVILNKNGFLLSNKLKSYIRKITGSLNLPFINAHTTQSKEKYDLIHCAHCLSLNDSPWVMDIEGAWQFFISGKENKISKNIVKNILLSENCKKIMPWTNRTKNEILNIFPEIKNKIEVVYPSVPEKKFKKKVHKTVNILFIARYFFAKGGLETLEVMDILTNKYTNVRCFVVSDVPEDILRYYKNNKQIKFYGLIKSNKLNKEIYPNMDILLYPGYSDSFGFAFLEAMSFGIPIITVDGVSRKEIVTAKNGIVVKKPNIQWDNLHPYIHSRNKHINELVCATEKLIKMGYFRYTLSQNNLLEIKEGKFSSKRRNEQLNKIYNNALK